MIADDLLFTYRKYPLMRAQDFVKMLYQGEYGGAHGNNDDLAAADSLKKEIKSMKPVSFKEELVEDISANFRKTCVPQRSAARSESKSHRPEPGLFL